MSNIPRLGKLKFKEGMAKPNYISKKNKKQEDEKGEEAEDVVGDDQFIKYEPKAGSGKITTSGRTIHGIDTKFREEV